MGINFAWNDETVAELKRLFSAGLSFSQIASAMSGVNGHLTRNAAIGKHRRMWGPSGRESACAPRCVVRAPKAPVVKPLNVRAANASAIHAKVKLLTEPPAPPTPFVAREATPDPAVEPRHWSTRRYGECSWPVGGDGHSTLSCCARAVRGGWCGPHAEIGFQQSKTSGKELMRSLRRYA